MVFIGFLSPTLKKKVTAEISYLKGAGGVPAFIVSFNIPIFGCRPYLSSNFLTKNKIGHY